MKPTTAIPVRFTSAVALLAALSGCAGMSDADCRGADWYDVGYRDARLKLQSQESLYANQCEAYGVKIDGARYAQGLREGRYDFPDRMM